MSINNFILKALYISMDQNFGQEMYVRECTRLMTFAATSNDQHGITKTKKSFLTCLILSTTL
jgi:hypothetical protein